MGEEQRKTTLLPTKTRADRQKELQALLQIPDGMDYLVHIYQANCGRHAGAAPPAGPDMIQAILAEEFPES